MEGELEVEIEDFPDQTSRTRHFLKTESGRRHEVQFRRHARHLVSGSRVRVQGSMSPGAVLTTEGGAAEVQEMAAATSYATGVQKTAVILVNFQDNASQPQTAAAVRNLVFGPVSDFFKENSFQTTSLSGDVFGWYTIACASTSCSTSTIKSLARAKATAAGANLSAYTRFVYIFPNTSAFRWAGYGQIGGSPTDAWINGYFDRKIIAHELGHNFGLNHAHSQSCGTATVGGACTTAEYGDLVDTMGWGLYGHFSAYEKEYLGWLNFNGMPPIKTVQASGSYTLAPYAGGSGVKALKILKGSDSATGAKTWYYLEYRQPTGFDSGLAGVGNLTSGVSVRTGNGSGGSYLLDMTPNSNSSSDYNDFKDAALAVGKTFTDASAGVKFTVAWANGTGAGINVTLGSGAGAGAAPATTTASCTRAKPSVLLSSSQSAAVAAGTPVSYTLAVTNKDSAACGPSTFNLAKAVPAGWSAALAAASLSIAPGSAASTTLKATSPGTATAGSYSVSGTATNAAGALAGSASASYVLGTLAGQAPAASQAPVAINDNASTGKSAAVKIAVLANDRDSAGKPLSLVKADAAGKGAVKLNGDGTLTYTPNAGFAGTDGFTYTVSNGSKTAWATVYVAVK